MRNKLSKCSVLLLQNASNIIIYLSRVSSLNILQSKKGLLNVNRASYHTVNINPLYSNFDQVILFFKVSKLLPTFKRIYILWLFSGNLRYFCKTYFLKLGFPYFCMDRLKYLTVINFERYSGHEFDLWVRGIQKNINLFYIFKQM